MRITVVSLMLAMVLLTGCGVKPSAVDPPAGTEKGAKDPFPKTYPDPSTDPDPHRYIRR